MVPCLTTVISSQGPPDQKGVILGIFRSIGALARALGPISASLSKSIYSVLFISIETISLVFWRFGSAVCYSLGAILLTAPLVMAINLKKHVSNHSKSNAQLKWFISVIIASLVTWTSSQQSKSEPARWRWRWRVIPNLLDAGLTTTNTEHILYLYKRGRYLIFRLKDVPFDSVAKSFVFLNAGVVQVVPVLTTLANWYSNNRFLNLFNLWL